MKRIRVLLASTITVLGLSTTVGVATSAPVPSFTVTLPPGEQPSWFLPLTPNALASTATIEDFQHQLYRPLYWMAGSPSYAPDQTLSLALPPVYNTAHTAVTVTLKPGLRWSSGTPVTTTDLMFFLNLATAWPSAWYATTPDTAAGLALGLPDLIRAVTRVNAAAITLTLARPVNPTWFTANDLSQLTPLPPNWDIRPTAILPSAFPAASPSLTLFRQSHGSTPVSTAGCWSNTWVGSGNHGASSGAVPGQTTAALDPSGAPTLVTDANAQLAQTCRLVLATLRAASADTSDYVTTGSTVASLVNTTDGPWQVSSFSAAAGTYTLDHTATRTTSARSVTFLACPTAAACANDVLAGTAESGLADLSTLPVLTSPLLASTTRISVFQSHHVNWQVQGSAGANAIFLNVASTLGPNKSAGVVLANSSVRQALQLAINQTALSSVLYHGWALPTTSILPPAWPTTSGSALSVAHAAQANALLTNHGWLVKADGTTVCVRPGTLATQCGAGIAAQTPLSFTLRYVSDKGPRDAAMRVLQTQWQAIGVTLTLIPSSLVGAETTVYDRLGAWDMVWFGSGLRSTTKPYPSAEDFLSTRGLFSPGSLPAFDGSYAAVTGGTATLPSFATTLTSGAPLLFLPTPLLVSMSRLANAPTNATGSLTPETWRR